MIRRVYGLSIESAIDLPELETGEGVPDVRITRGVGMDDAAVRWVHEYAFPAGEKWLAHGRVAAGHLLRFHDVADFAVAATGDAIEARPRDGLPDATLRHLLLDHVLPLTLNVRGKDALHATAVVTPRGLCALLGETGAGKSTLAASFALAGHAVACDDCLVVSVERDSVRAHAGYAGLRLTAETLAAFGIAGDPPGDGWRKRRVVLGPALGTFDRTFPLAAVYALSPAASGAAQPLIEPLSGRDAFVQLAEASFRMDIEDAAMLARQLALFGELAERVPLRRVSVPRSFSAVFLARDAILREVEAGS